MWLDFGGKIENAEQAQKLVSKINDRLTALGTEKRIKIYIGSSC